MSNKDKFKSQIEELSNLQDGWYDGFGKSPNPDALEKFASIMNNYPNDLPYPYIFPKECGNILLEWRIEGSPSLDLNLSDFSGHFHSFDNQCGETKISLNISRESDFNCLVQQIKKYF